MGQQHPWFDAGGVCPLALRPKEQEATWTDLSLGD